MHVLPICMHAFFFNYRPFSYVHCTLCEEKRKMSQILVFNNASAVFKIMQNVSTLQEFTACCLSRLDGRYTMTFNWYLKRRSNVYSVLQQFDRKKDKRCSVLRVSHCFSLLNMESLWLNTSWEGVLFNTNVVFWWKEEMKKGFTIQLNAENRQRPRHTTQQQMIISYTMGGTTKIW